MENKLLNPDSIAIVGVSHETNKVGYLVAKNLINQGYQGKIYLVNRKGGKVLGKTIYKSLSDIKQPIDLVVLAVPVDVVLMIIDEIGKLNIKNILVYAAGFKEVGGEGIKKEKLLFDKAKTYNLNIIGPNCVGFINTEKNINLTFLRHQAPTGNIGIISQSGALGSLLLDYYQFHQNLGLTYFLSLGNKTLFDESSALEILVNDKKTEVIGMYLEDVTDGKRFLSTLKKVTKIKPVVILKSGVTQAGAKAALSHTGSLVGSDNIYQSAFDQSGAIRAQNLDEYLMILKILSYKKIPQSSNILVITNAGGVGVLLTDELITQQLNMVTITDKTKNSIIKKLDPMHRVTIHNPIDVLGDAKANDFKIVMNEAIKDRSVGAIITLLTPQANTEISETTVVISQIQKKYDRPIFPIFLGGIDVESGLRYFERHKIAGFSSFNYLPSSINKILRWTKSQKIIYKPQDHIYKLSILGNKLDIDNIFKVNTSHSFLSVMDSLDIMQLIDIPVPAFSLIKSTTELNGVINKIGYPAVVKINSDKITHKTEVHGVITNLKTVKEINHAIDKLSQVKNINGFLIQKMIKGVEFIVGGKKDNDFGTTVVFGLGGIYTELIKQVINLVHPFSYEDFKLAIKNTSIEKILLGFRSSGQIDDKKIYEVLLKVAYLMEEYPKITEIDINPLIASSSGVYAVDGRIVI